MASNNSPISINDLTLYDELLKHYIDTEVLVEYDRVLDILNDNIIAYHITINLPESITYVKPYTIMITENIESNPISRVLTIQPDESGQEYTLFFHSNATAISIRGNYIVTTDYELTDNSEITLTSKTIVEIPVASALSFTYAPGVDQGPTFSGSDDTKYTVSNNIKSDAGNYTATITLTQRNTMWSDFTFASKTYDYVINKAYLAKPKLGTDTFTYDGTEKSYIFSQYDARYYTKSGDVTETNAGSYTTTVTLLDPINSSWGDSTITPLNYNWIINKAARTIPLNDSYHMASSDSTTTINLVVPEVIDENTVVITTTDENFITGSFDNNVIILTRHTDEQKGIQVTITISETANYLGCEKTINFTYGEMFEGLDSWANSDSTGIAKMLNNYYNGYVDLNFVKQYWSIGEKRTISLPAFGGVQSDEKHSAQDVELVIIDFEHDDLATPINNRTKALITVELKDSLGVTLASYNEKGVMNTYESVDGWKNCGRRTWCNETFFNVLPSYLKEGIKTVKKMTTAGSTVAVMTEDKVFLPSEIEVHGSKYYSRINQSATNNEGTQYEYYKTVNNRRKYNYKNSNTWSNCTWWSRSQWNFKNWVFFKYGDRDYPDWGNSTGWNGISPAFCL